MKVFPSEGEARGEDVGGRGSCQWKPIKQPCEKVGRKFGITKNLAHAEEIFPLAARTTLGASRAHWAPTRFAQWCRHFECVSRLSLSHRRGHRRERPCCHETSIYGHTGTPITIPERAAAPANRSFEESETLMFRLQDGKIIESWATWDR